MSSLVGLTGCWLLTASIACASRAEPTAQITEPVVVDPPASLPQATATTTEPNGAAASSAAVVSSTASSTAPIPGPAAPSANASAPSSGFVIPDGVLVGGKVLGEGPAIGHGSGGKGKLDPEAIRGVVRASMSKYRACYERALESAPTLEGKVTIAFTIGTEGKVLSATDKGSTLSDKAVIDCVAHAFAALTFPKPQGGTVNVVYPLVFTQAE